MLTYKFLNKIDGVFVFAYYPNGNQSAPGKIAISGDGKGHIIEESKADFGKRYAFHAIRGIDTAAESGTVAWY